MQIIYIGATENSNYKRFAVIQHTKEEEAVNNAQWFHKDDRYPYMRYCPYCNVKMIESEEQRWRSRNESRGNKRG